MSISAKTDLKGAVPSLLRDLPIRIGLVSAGMILFNSSLNLWAQEHTFSHPSNLGLSFLGWALGTALIILALIPRTDSRVTWLILVGLLCAQLVNAYLSQLSFSPLTTSHTDNEMIAQFAAQALKRGHNPYTWNFSDILRVFRDRGLNFTPFLDGTFQSRLTYPILPTLILTACDLFGIGQVRVINLVSQVVLLTLVFVGAPARYRPVVLIPLFLLKDFVLLPLNGIQDVVWSTLLVGVILAWRRPVLRAVLFGLAAAYRQQPWFVAPFLLITMWNEPGTVENRRRRIAAFTAASLSTFVLVNLPFIVWYPRAWWLGSFEPAYATFNVYSYGLGALSQYGLVPFSRQFFLGLQISSLLIMLIIHWRHPRIIGQAFWMFPAIFFWLYYRGLTNYWIYWIPPLILALANQGARNSASDAAGAGLSSRWKGTATLAVSLLVLNVLWGVVLFQRRPVTEISSFPPFEVIDYGRKLVARLTVTVINTSDADLVPRFAVQRDPGVQALPWAIDSGPEILGPGQSGEFVISTSVAARAFAVEDGGQIVVTDARGDYWRRAVKTIPADTSFTDPDAIVNPGFEFWPSSGDAPEAWSLRTTAGSSGTARAETVAGKSALMILLGKDSKRGDLAAVRLAQTITFPPEFAVWVYPTLPDANPLQQAFGLELDDGEHRLWILFGDSDSRGRLDDDLHYIYLPAPQKEWSRHMIRPRELYALFGWELPPFSPRLRNGLEFPARQVQLSLLVASRSPAGSPGVFGPIEQEHESTAPAVFLAEALAHPDTYYVNVGDEYRRQRNYRLAQDAYLKALTYDEGNAKAYFGLAEARFWRDDWVGAIAAFETSIDYGYHRPALAYRGMGWSYYNLLRYNEAQHAFKKAIRIDSELADAYNGLGWVLVQENRCDEAIPYFERARALAPDFPDPQWGIEECERSK